MKSWEVFVKDKFSIGELARLFDISTDTLRHYDKLSLLKPDSHTESGYRYYSLRSLFKLSRILFFKQLDISLEEIRAYMRHKNKKLLTELLLKKHEELQGRIQKLTNLQFKIEEKLGLLEEGTKALEVIRVKTLGERSGVFIDVKNMADQESIKDAFKRVERYLKTSSWLIEGQIYTSVSKGDLLSKRYTQFRYFVEVITLQQEACPQLTRIPDHRYACLVFNGPYSQMSEQYSKIVQWIEDNGYEIAGDSIEKNIVDYDFADSEAEYISEIQIPIVPRRS